MKERMASRRCSRVRIAAALSGRSRKESSCDFDVALATLFHRKRCGTATPNRWKVHCGPPFAFLKKARRWNAAWPAMRQNEEINSVRIALQTLREAGNSRRH